MKSTRLPQLYQLRNPLDVCIDVSKDMLNAYFQAGGHGFDDAFANRTSVIEERLDGYASVARQHGHDGLRVLCEPSGAYQDKLLSTARRCGHLTAYVSGEGVAKMRVVESNDTGKTDIKDPHVIHTLADIDKVLLHRPLHGDYLLLRKLGVLYDRTDTQIVALRGRLHKAVLELFCDYSFKNDFLYSTAGQALMACYRGNPYRIVRAGRSRFERTLKKRAQRIHKATLARLWRDAQHAVRHQLEAEYVDLLERQLRQLWDDYRLQEQRKAQLADQLVAVLHRLRQTDPNVPSPTPGVISAVNLARLLAETGPLSDFPSWRRLLRYAGINICMRQSGTYKGRYKISKKGRPRLRKILGQIVLPLVRRDALYGPFYHRKRVTMPGPKAMTAVMRHFLRKLHGWYRSGQEFDAVRHFNAQHEPVRQQAA